MIYSYHFPFIGRKVSGNEKIMCCNKLQKKRIEIL